jgi:hypothetical protein
MTTNNSLKQTKNERVYSLDALRGIMMLLGLIIHTAITYGTLNFGDAWNLKDPESTNYVFDLIVGYIHVFRMPVFMVAAGYFGALLFYKKGGGAMLRNRFNRIFLPLAAGVLLIYPLIRFAFSYSNEAFAGAPDAWNQSVSYIISGGFLPFKTAHLWFIYYLILFSVAGFLIATIFNKKSRISDLLNDVFKKITLNFWLRLISSSFVVFICLYWMESTFLKTNNSFTIEWSVFFTYFMFYSTGWMFYRTDCLMQLSKNAWIQLAIATLLFLAVPLTPWPNETWVLTAQQILIAISTSLFVFGFIALFLVYFHAYSRTLAYLMESAYWVYIIHLPIVAFIPGLLAPFALNIVAKFLIVFTVTTFLSFASYHYLVRGTFIGKFLNGKIFKNEKTVLLKVEV